METKPCPICSKGEMSPKPSSVALCSLTSYTTTCWDCDHCGAQRWDSLWEEQDRKKQNMEG